MNKLDLDYQGLLADILKNGVVKTDRTGTGTISVFGRTIRHRMSDGFPLLTTKKMYWKGIVAELLWFLRGDTNIKYLLDNNCHIWDGDAHQSYLKEFGKLKNLESGQYCLTKEEFIDKIKTNNEFAEKWGNLGRIYGHQWRNWEGFDQISELINQLKTNPDSRRMLVSAWAVHDLPNMVLPPCHYGFQCYTRMLTKQERMDWYYTQYNGNKGLNPEHIEFELDEENVPKRELSLSFNMRSCDVPLGLPFNIASYGILLEILCKHVNMVSGELIGNLGDAHVYTNQIDGAIEQIGRELRIDERCEIMLRRSLVDNEWYDNVFSNFNKLGKIQYLNKLKIPVKTREPFVLPVLAIKTPNDGCFKPEEWLVNDFEIIGYNSHPSIKYPLSN